MTRPAGADPAEWARFCEQRDRAAQVITDALAALLAGDDQRLQRVLDPVARSSSLWFLVTGGAISMLAELLPEPLGPHDCDNPVCPVASNMLDLWMRGEASAVRQMLFLTGTVGTVGKRMDLLGYMLTGLELAVNAGVTPPPAPSATLGPEGQTS